MKFFIVELWLKKGFVGEKGFGNELKESWFFVRDFILNELDFGNEFLEIVFDFMEKFEFVLLIVYNEDVILFMECFKKLVDGVMEILFVILIV